MNTTTIIDAFPLQFIDGALDVVARHEVYNFLDNFSRYNQIQMHLDDHEKVTVTEWGIFIIVVMMFGLKTASTTFQRIIMEIFGEYFPAFMQAFLDDFVVYSRRVDHLDHLRPCLEKCLTTHLSLNPVKCAFEVTSDTLLGHIVNQKGIVVDPDNLVKAILEVPILIDAIVLNQFLGQIRLHNRMLRYLADFATPLHAAIHQTSFQWTEIKGKA